MSHSPETILNAIECLTKSGHAEAAAWAMDKMQVDFPDTPALFDEMAARAYAQGDMDQAQACFEKAAAVAPRQADIQKNLGDFYYVVLKDAERALAQYLKVLEIDPQHVDTLMLAGHVSISLHRYPEAQQYYQQVQAIDPENPMALEFLQKMGHGNGQADEPPMSVADGYAAATELVNQGKRAEAMDLLQKVLEADGGHAAAHNDLGVLHYEAGDMEQARQHYEQAADLAPESETFQKNLADFYWAQLGDPQKALQQYLRVLKLAPQDIEALLGCGQICLCLQKPDDARDFVDSVLTHEPWNEDARQLMRQLDPPAPALTPAQPGLGEDDLYVQAQGKASAGDLDGAIGQLKQLLAQEPGLARAHNDLGVLYYETGEMDQAESSYQQAVQLDPNALDFRKNLADFYLFERGRAEDAMKLYLQILESDAEDVEALNAVGLVCASLGQMDDARHFYHRVLEIEPWNDSAQSALDNMQSGQDGGSGDAVNHAAAG